MKITIELSEYEEEQKLKRMFKADDLYMALHDIVNRVFRPARKHGYSDRRIAAALDKADQVLVQEEGGTEEVEAGTELIALLENEFFRILEAYGIRLDDLP